MFFGIGFGLTFITYARYVWTDEKPAPAFAITMSLLKLAAPLVGATLTAYAGPLGKLPGTRHADS
ncbi:hypothetical protein [Lacipirellula limnantheis]|uniref:Uncharacterized protein n=1 Tax=Lacipirellula limnantheis TaxID=2528024 RepID=A0A517U140_9BACT|nr:hypothetical protein [Lacipirellula limnantheis]QDT74335.1 hypothetical protein I41_35300 [Lacipirellula limnantheis]